MAFPSLDVPSEAGGNTIGGAAKTIAAPLSGLALGSKASTALFGASESLIKGGTRAVQSTAERLVGGSKNLELIESATGNVISGAKDLLSGKQTIGGMISGAFGETGSITGTISGVVGGDILSDLLGIPTVGEGSDWGYLSKHLLARIYACDADGIALPSEPLGVVGPVTDLNQEITYNWQSPFESTGPEAKAPALMAMLQTGSLVPVINAIQAVNPVTNDTVNGYLSSAASKAKEIAKSLEGRTGITKLNSRQVFSGMPPIKLSMMLYFRAISDAENEVVAPYQRLLEWSMPQGLAADGVLTEVIASTGSQNSSFLKAMFPSIAPLMVGFNFGNNRYPAMVIESMSNPLDGPADRSGKPIYRAVQLTLATLTALDRADIKKLLA